MNNKNRLVTFFKNPIVIIFTILFLLLFIMIVGGHYKMFEQIIYNYQSLFGSIIGVISAYFVMNYQLKKEKRNSVNSSITVKYYASYLTVFYKTKSMIEMLDNFLELDKGVQMSDEQNEILNNFNDDSHIYFIQNDESKDSKYKSVVEKLKKELYLIKEEMSIYSHISLIEDIENILTKEVEFKNETNENYYHKNTIKLKNNITNLNDLINQSLKEMNVKYSIK